MTQQDKDREAFEKVYRELGRMYSLQRKSTESGELYVDNQTQEDYEIWQAARDHYAPNLTEKEALEKAIKAMAEVDRDDVGSSLPELNYFVYARAALRAVGVRFKDSGDEK